MVVFCLPPHTTHECQPLDCSLFGPLKTHWRNVCHSFHQKFPSAVITKFNFCGLFKGAWLQAITPETIVGGFRKAGVYPYNPRCISALKNAGESSGAKSSGDVSAAKGDDVSGDGFSPGDGEDNDSSSDSADGADNEYPFDDGLCGDGHNGAADLHGGNPSSDCSSYPGGGSDFGSKGGVSAKTEALYQQRYEEGYDPDYVLWLEEHHPEDVPADRYTLTSTNEQQPLYRVEAAPLVQNNHTDPSMITPSSAKSATPTSSASSVSQSGGSAASSSHNLTTPLLAKSATPTSSASSVSQSGGSASSSSHSHLNLITPLLAKSATSSDSASRSIVSQFLPSLPNVTPSQSSSTKQGRARVLTSKECLDLLAEKEQKKQQQEEEKERRKLEREMKRKEREKEMKWKAEERARKAAEKAKRDAEKAKRVEERAAEKARKAAEKAANKAPVVSSRRKGRSTSKGTSESSAGPSEQEEQKLKVPRLVDEDIDIY